MESLNKEYLSRINKILGKRKKHPWGRAIGLKANRIHDIFSGKIPSADALIRIKNAEKISIDWLITGEGAPYLYKAGIQQSDERNAQILKNLLGPHEWVVFVMYHNIEQGVSVAITRPRIIDYGDDKGRFIDVEIMQAGPQVLKALDNRFATWLYCDADIYEELITGEIGPEDLDSDKFENRGQVELSDLIEILEKPESNSLANLDESKLLSSYRHLNNDQRQALQNLLKTIENSSDDFHTPPHKTISNG